MYEIKSVIRDKVKDTCCKKILYGKRIFLFGFNSYTECINNFLHNEGFEITGILDNDNAKQGRNVSGITILSPNIIDWKSSDVVLIASKHIDEMQRQIYHLCKEVEVVSLVDFVRCKEEQNKEEKFWLEEKYESEMQVLQRGAAIYDEINEDKKLVIFPTSALGDMFIGGLYLYNYRKEIETGRIRIIIASKSIYKVTQLFGLEDVAIMISKDQMDALTKFVLFHGTMKDYVYSWMLAEIASYKKNTFPQYWAKYIFRLGNNYQMKFPSIWDKRIREKDLIDKGLVKGRSIILAPYANSICELPWQFWEVLTRELLKQGYFVFTNIAANQKPVHGSIEIEIPLQQIGNYLEFAGYFVSLRSGLCDIAGHAKCKKVVIFRNEKSTSYSSEIEFFDLHSENEAPDAIQYIYDDLDLHKNIYRIRNYLLELKESEHSIWM